MARRVIDLSQPLSNQTQLHPFFLSVQILRQVDARRREAGRVVHRRRNHSTVTSNHVATRCVDALRHFDSSPGAARIAEMPLETSCGEAVW